MENYILKLNSGTEYKLYKGTTLVSDSDLTTLFGTAGEMYLSFDFNSGTPSDLTTLTITNSSDVAVISNSNLTDAIAEGKNYKATWSNSATTFDTFEELEGKALDESQLSFLMGKIKNAGGMKPFYLTQTDNSPATLENAFYEVLFPADVTTQQVRYIYDGTYLHPKVGFRSNMGYKLFMLKTGQTLMFFGDWDMAMNLSGGAQIYSGGWSSILVIPNYSRQNSGFLLTAPSGIPSASQRFYNIVPLSAAQGKVLADSIGTLSSLTTTAKTSAVAAINEVNGKAAGISETLTIATSDWTALSASDPYDYSATVTATTTISATSTVELVNDQAVLFATYGFAIGSVDTTNNTLTIYSIGQPSASVSLTIKVRS